MSDSMTTSLSAFIDGEASTEEVEHVVPRLSEDEMLRREWKNYHTIASVLRRESVSNKPSPVDWDALAATLPENGDILPFRPRSRFKSILLHGGIGAGLAACIMVGMFFIFSNSPTETDPTLAISSTSEGTSLTTIPIEELPLQPLSFDESFSISVSTISPDIHEELRQITLEALHAYDISRSGMDGSLMPAAAANVVSRKVSKEL